MGQHLSALTGMCYPVGGQTMGCNDEASEATPEDIFGNPVILNRILDQLPNHQLLKLSLVSKLWKKEARIVMKKRGNVMAFLRYRCDDVRGCGIGDDFKAFAANLETLNEPLYSGMTICLRPSLHCALTGVLEVERIHESILAGMRGKLTRLSAQLDFGGVYWNNIRDCPNSLLLWLLLRDFIGDLEHLSLEIEGHGIQDNMETFMQNFLPVDPYPKLKVLKLKDVHLTSIKSFDNQIKLLLSRAPNLQEIHTYGWVSLCENLMEGREGVVHVHESGLFLLEPMEDISEIAIPALRLKRINLLYNTDPQLELDRFNEKAQSLLRTCCATTLENLTLDAVSAVLFMSYRIQLVNVEDLSIRLDYDELEEFEPRILSILSRFDYTHLFPSLKRVHIYPPGGMRSIGDLSPGTVDAIMEQANAISMEPTLPGAGNLEYLSFTQDSITVAAIEFLAQIFPAIKELCAYPKDKVFPVESAWELWRNLKRMEVNRKSYHR